MAIDYQMTWVPDRKGWMKTRLGKTYSVSCRQLGTPPTKSESWRAANAWWQDKERALAETAQAAHQEHESSYEAHRARLQARRASGTLAGQEDAGDDTPDDWAPTPQALRVADRVTSLERADFFADAPAKLATNRTLGFWFDEWVRVQQQAAKPRDGGRKGRITAARADNKRIALSHFVDFLGRDMDVEVACTRLRAYHAHCEGKGWSAEYAKTVFGITTGFLRWLDREEVISRLPRNLNSPDFRFKVAPKKIPTFTMDEVHTLLANATGQTRLHLMLFINCGMTQQDVADLRHDEVDWAEGRVIRKRSKHSDKRSADIPTANFKLWARTWELLQEYRSDHPTLVLVTQSGKPWVYSELTPEGKRRGADNFRSCFVHLVKKTGITKPPKLMRKTSASLLNEHAHYGRYASHFLGNSPKGISERNYVAPSVVLFDEIVGWLGEQYGF